MHRVILDSNESHANQAAEPVPSEQLGGTTAHATSLNVSPSIFGREFYNPRASGGVLPSSLDRSARSGMNGTLTVRRLPNRIQVSDFWRTGKTLAVEVPSETWTVPSFRFYDIALLDYVAWDSQFCGARPTDAQEPVEPSFWSRRESEYRRFSRQLIVSLLEEPIEDGVGHPAEELISDVMQEDRSFCLDGLSRILIELYDRRTSLCASVLRCIGRLEKRQAGQWGLQVVDDALNKSDVEVREAAIRALESWGGSDALDLLREYRETESWLSDYVRQVIADLESELA